MQKLVERIFWVTLLLVVVGSGTALAVRNSGPGQTTKANSLSVAVASDQNVPTVAVLPTKVTAVTPSAFTNLTTFCQDGIRVGGTGDAGIVVVMTGMDGGVTDAGAQTGVTLAGVSAGTYLNGAFSYVLPAGTSVTDIKCFGH